MDLFNFAKQYCDYQTLYKAANGGVTKVDDFESVLVLASKQQLFSSHSSNTGKFMHFFKFY